MIQGNKIMVNYNYEGHVQWIIPLSDSSTIKASCISTTQTPFAVSHANTFQSFPCDDVLIVLNNLLMCLDSRTDIKQKAYMFANRRETNMHQLNLI